jgi:hypothetical protein
LTPVATREDAVVRLQSRIGDLRAVGVERLARFGSVGCGGDGL